MKGVFAILIVSAMVFLAMVNLGEGQVVVDPTHGQQIITKPKLDCGQVKSAVAPCASYLLTGQNPPTLHDNCCSGIENLKAITPSEGERRTACSCLKQYAVEAKLIHKEAVISLPQICGVAIEVPVSAEIDCSKMK